MLGLGELLAHEAAFRLGWSGTKVGFVLFPLSFFFGLLNLYMQIFPTYRRTAPVGPGIELREVRDRRRGPHADIGDAAALE